MPKEPCLSYCLKKIFIKIIVIIVIFNYKHGCKHVFQPGSHKRTRRFGLVLILDTMWPIKYNFKKKNYNSDIIIILLHFIYLFLYKIIKCDNIFSFLNKKGVYNKNAIIIK